jgi:TetR/AcrR family transcriptional regulator, transcriptional repressor for nem operon
MQSQLAPSTPKSAAELGATDAAAEKTVERACAWWTADLAECVEDAQRDGAIDASQNSQALATTLLAFMRGQEALHKGGAKPAALKAAADEMVSLIPTG